MVLHECFSLVLGHAGQLQIQTLQRLGDQVLVRFDALTFLPLRLLFDLLLLDLVLLFLLLVFEQELREHLLVISGHLKCLPSPDIISFDQEDLIEIINKKLTLHSDQLLPTHSFQIISNLQANISTKENWVLFH